jgi:hypothetical protein
VKAHGTAAVATSPHSSDGLSDIFDPLVLASIVVTGILTSVAHRYWPHNSDRHSDISGPSLLVPIVVTGYPTTTVCRYWIA